jgi:1-phosphofructokinase family hexose kinase
MHMQGGTHGAASSPVVTITLNPSIDRTTTVSELTIGQITRAQSTTLDPGGKGVNVSRAVNAFGGATHAILVCGELGASWMDKQLSALSIPHTIIPSDGAVRSNMTIVSAGGVVTKINEPGVALTASELNAVQGAITSQVSSGSWVVLAGRSNPGLALDTYRDLATLARKSGARVAVDTSGDELKAALTAGVVDLIKPNQFELAELVGRPLATVHDIIDAAREVISGGVQTVLCSLGADGALLITAQTVTHCEPAHAVSGTPVGAGDILLGIFLAAGADEAALETAVAWSAASVPLPGTSIPTPAQAAAMPVKINSSINQTRTLVETH